MMRIIRHISFFRSFRGIDKRSFLHPNIVFQLLRCPSPHDPVCNDHEGSFFGRMEELKSSHSKSVLTIECMNSIVHHECMNYIVHTPEQVTGGGINGRFIQ